jgi:molybdopterin adenylyltransferase
MRVAVLTISTLGAEGRREDVSGEAIAEWARGHGYEVAARAVVADDTVAIAGKLCQWADGRDGEEGGVDLIVTTGGTGLAATDRTPEATRAVLEKEAPGIAEYLRARAWPAFPRAALSRGLAGVRGASLIINLPGSPSGVRDALGALDDFVSHAIELLRGRTEH